MALVAPGTVFLLWPGKIPVTSYYCVVKPSCTLTLVTDWLVQVVSRIR